VRFSDGAHDGRNFSDHFPRDRERVPALEVTMRALSTIVVAIAVLVAGCDGCNGGKGTAPASSATATPSASVVAPASATASGSAGRRDHPGMRGRGGATASLFAAARTLDLKPEQKTKLDELQKKLDGADATPRDEMKDVHEAVIAGVKAGKIDSVKLDPLLADVEKAAKDRQDKEAEVMNGIYATLEPAQRTAAVKEIREKQAARDERMSRRGGRDGGGYDPARWQKARLARMTKELDLDAEQQKKVEAALPKTGKGAPETRAEAKKRLDAVLAAFEKDGFDAKKIAAPDPKHARAPLDDEAKVLAAILPALKPEQREKLASSMTRGGKGSHGRRGGDHHRPAVGHGDDDDDDGDDD
jgi:Spy/CpxP family protein refolding chaperone